jgi:predicted RNA-binding Zn-ribbon protein involved in translation (DUF1610 family)
MSSEKSVILIPASPKHLCPICGKASYSAGGIHPQCAMQQADEPRMTRLRAAKVAETKTKKPARTSWKKRCPMCGTEMNVRCAACKCGHKFEQR